MDRIYLLPKTRHAPAGIFKCIAISYQRSAPATCRSVRVFRAVASKRDRLQYSVSVHEAARPSVSLELHAPRSTSTMHSVSSAPLAALPLCAAPHTLLRFFCQPKLFHYAYKRCSHTLNLSSPSQLPLTASQASSSSSSSSSSWLLSAYASTLPSTKIRLLSWTARQFFTPRRGDASSKSV